MLPSIGRHKLENNPWIWRSLYRRISRYSFGHIFVGIYRWTPLQEVEDNITGEISESDESYDVNSNPISKMLDNLKDKSNGKRKVSHNDLSPILNYFGGGEI